MKPGRLPLGFLPSHPTWLRTLVLSQAIGERRGLTHGRRKRRPGEPVGRGPQPGPATPPSESE